MNFFASLERSLKRGLQVYQAFHDLDQAREEENKHDANTASMYDSLTASNLEGMTLPSSNASDDCQKVAGEVGGTEDFT